MVPRSHDASQKHAKVVEEPAPPQRYYGRRFLSKGFLEVQVAASLHLGRFNDDEAGAPGGKSSCINQMPTGRKSIFA
jgi:hypothetical protein